jgi:hypothetical protein
MHSRLFAAIVLLITIFTSCDGDPDNLYGKRKEFQILDEYGSPTTHAYASKISGTYLKIVGGIGSNHVIEVEDETVIMAEYSHRGASGNILWMDTTYPAGVHITPLKFGSTTVSITDTDIDKTIHVQVDVVNEYEALTIKESSVEGLEKGMKIAFAIDATNEYRIAAKEGSEYYSVAKGEYHFHEYVPENYNNPENNYLLLTLKDSEGETTWKITDADNNKDGNKNYVDDLLEGLKLSNRVTTKFSPAFHYPTLFLFTDTANPDRHFVTGRCNENIKWTFE